MKVEKEISAVLQARKPDTDMINVLEALGYGTAKFQEAFDVAISRAFEIGPRLSVLARDVRDCTRNHRLKRRGY